MLAIAATTLYSSIGSHSVYSKIDTFQAECGDISGSGRYSVHCAGTSGIKVREKVATKDGKKMTPHVATYSGSANDVSMTKDGHHFVALDSDATSCEIKYYRRDTRTNEWLTSAQATIDCNTNGGMTDADTIEISDEHPRTIVIASYSIGKIAVYTVNTTLTGITLNAAQPDPGSAADQFGRDISVSSTGQTIIVGIPEAKNEANVTTGRVDILRYDSGNDAWIEKTVYGSDFSLKNTETTSDSYFGHSVSMSDDYFAVGAPFAMDIENNNENAGALVVFKQEGTEDPVLQGSVSYGYNAGDHLGYNTEIHLTDGDVLTVGVTSIDADKIDGANGTFAGLIRVIMYDESENEWDPVGIAFGPSDSSGIGVKFALSTKGSDLFTNTAANDGYLYELTGMSKSASDNAKMGANAVGSMAAAVLMLLM